MSAQARRCFGAEKGGQGGGQAQPSGRARPSLGLGVVGRSVRRSNGPAGAVGAGVPPRLVRALGGRAVQRGSGEGHPKEQPGLLRAGEAVLPPHIGRSVSLGGSSTGLFT